MQWDLDHCLKLLLFYTFYEFYLLYVLRESGIAFYKSVISWVSWLSSVRYFVLLLVFFPVLLVEWLAYFFIHLTRQLCWEKLNYRKFFGSGYWKTVLYNVYRKKLLRKNKQVENRTKNLNLFNSPTKTHLKADCLETMEISFKYPAHLLCTCVKPRGKTAINFSF